MPHIFAYGTLQFEEVVQRLTGKTFTSTPAQLFSYQRYLVTGCDYPAILPSEKHVVVGTLIFDVDELSMQRLIFFEGDDYKMVEEQVLADKKKVKAIVFVWKKSPRLLSQKDWSLEQFKKEALREYVSLILPETLQEYLDSKKNKNQQH